METCVACGAPTARAELLPTYDDDGIGIPVTLRNGVLHHKCDSCGFDGVEIIDSTGLTAAAAVARILLPVTLSGDEVRFLRKACEMNGKEFAEALHCDNAVLSRWENGGGFGAVTERTIRNTVWGILYRKVPAIQIEPGHFERMKIFSLPEGSEISRLTLERVRLKDRTLQRKTDEWDIAA